MPHGRPDKLSQLDDQLRREGLAFFLSFGSFGLWVVESFVLFGGSSGL